MKITNLITTLMILAGSSFAEPQTTCPVMDGKINKKLHVDVEGYRIYVCCKPCMKVIKAAPAKFIAKMKADGVEPEKTPVAKK